MWAVVFLTHSCVLTLQVCSLERFRSLQDKLQLLEEAVSMHDGNVITAVSVRFAISPSVGTDGKVWAACPESGFLSEA